MANAYPTPASLSLQAPNVDLIRRYHPSLDIESCEELAGLIKTNGSGCWEWSRFSRTPQGYGYFNGEPTPYGYPIRINNHRYMFEVFVGNVPMDNHVHHRCHNKPCWHPLHLQSLTPKEHLDEHKQDRVYPSPAKKMRDLYNLPL